VKIKREEGKSYRGGKVGYRERESEKKGVPLLLFISLREWGYINYH